MLINFRNLVEIYCKMERVQRVYVSVEVIYRLGHEASIPNFCGEDLAGFHMPSYCKLNYPDSSDSRCLGDNMLAECERLKTARTKFAEEDIVSYRDTKLSIGELCIIQLHVPFKLSSCGSNVICERNGNLLPYTKQFHSRLWRKAKEILLPGNRNRPPTEGLPTYESRRGAIIVDMKVLEKKACCLEIDEPPAAKCKSLSIE